MKEITFKDALYKQFCSPLACFEQLGNIFFGLFRMLSLWILITTTYTLIHILK